MQSNGLSAKDGITSTNYKRNQSTLVLKIVPRKLESAFFSPDSVMCIGECIKPRLTASVAKSEEPP
jgi:hypothetical protein